MTFLNPFLLALLGLGALPVIIHLLNKRKSIVHDFAAFEFLLRSNIVTYKNLKLKQLLLMIIRILIIFLLVLAASMPVIKKDNENIIKNHKSRKIAAFFDNTHSMSYKKGDMSNLEICKRYLISYCKKLNIESVKIIPMFGDPFVINRDKIKKIYALKKQLNQIKQTNRYGKINDIIDRYRKNIEGNDFDIIMFFSDFHETTWMNLNDSVLVVNHKKIIFADASDPEYEDIKIINYDLKLQNSTDNEMVIIKSVIKNNTPKKIKNLSVSLKINDHRTINGLVDLFPFKEAVKEFTITDPPNRVKGWIKVKSENIENTNLRYFCFSFPSKNKILIVDGDQGFHYTFSETFFLKTALNANKNNRIKTVTPYEFEKASLLDFDIIFICNYVPENNKKILDFVLKGGGLFFSLGNKTDPDDFNRKFSDQLKLKLRGEKKGFLHKRAVTSFLQFPSKNHQAVSILKQIKNPANYEFDNLFLMQPFSASNIEPLLNLDSGEPLLMNIKKGKGRILLLLSTIDLDWNNFALRPFYVPFLKSSVDYLSQSNIKLPKDSLFVGDTIYIDGSNKARVIRPDNKKYSFNKKTIQNKFYHTNLPGIYEVISDDNTKKYAVNIDPLELNIKRKDFGCLKKKIVSNYIAKISIRDNDLSSIVNRTALWVCFFAFIFVLLVLEMFISSTYYGKNKGSNEN